MTSWKGKTINFISRLRGREIRGQTQMSGVSVEEMNEIICPGKYKRSEKKVVFMLLVGCKVYESGTNSEGNIDKSELAILLNLF